MVPVKPLTHGAKLSRFFSARDFGSPRPKYKITKRTHLAKNQARSVTGWQGFVYRTRVPNFRFSILKTAWTLIGYRFGAICLMNQPVYLSLGSPQSQKVTFGNSC